MNIESMCYVSLTYSMLNVNNISVTMSIIQYFTDKKIIYLKMDVSFITIKWFLFLRKTTKGNKVFASIVKLQTFKIKIIVLLTIVLK